MRLVHSGSDLYVSFSDLQFSGTNAWRTQAGLRIDGRPEALAHWRAALLALPGQPAARTLWIATIPVIVGTCLAWRRDDDSPVLRAFAATAHRVARAPGRDDERIDETCRGDQRNDDRQQPEAGFQDELVATLTVTTAFPFVI